MDDGGDGDFTFPAPPATATAKMSPSLQEDGLGLLWPRIPPTAAASSNLLWPFSSPSPTAAAAEEDERDEEERMDKLWEHARGDDEDDDVDVDMEKSERMDMLWEDFNDELLLQLRRRHHKRDLATPSSSPNDDDGCSLSSPSPSSAGYCYQGCAPTMLRASSRAGAVGHLYGRGGDGGRRSRPPTGWEILLRLFRKLFAVDKSSPSPPTPCSHRRHGSIYVP
uniref:Uncharacterized protein n=1 Tax=Leersia perrieri TaxID=77586 RepID=A0A0D9VH14_9ORYZ